MSTTEQAAAPPGRAAGPDRYGPLTWIQRQWLPERPDDQVTSFEDNMFREMSVDPMEFARVRSAVREVLARHEVLRSRAVGLGDDAYQVVDPVDPGCDLVLECVAPDGWEKALSAARRTCFRLSLEWPVRLLAGTEAGRVTRIAMVVDHWAADGLGVLALLDDLTAALRARAQGRDWTPEGPAEQPIDLARWESTTRAGADHLARATAYWRRQFERLRRDLGDYRPPADASPDGAAPLCFPGWTITSVRLARAASTIAERLKVPVAAVYLAAFSTAVGVAEQVGVVGTLMLSANRLTPAAMRSVRNAVASAPVVLDTSHPDGFAGTVAAAAAQQLQAFRYANVDSRMTGDIADEVLGDLRDCGVASAIFNFMPETALRGDRVPAIVANAPLDVLEPMPARTTAAERMFMVTSRGDRVIMTMRWREDKNWQQLAEPILRHVVDLIMRESDPNARPPAPGA